MSYNNKSEEYDEESIISLINENDNEESREHKQLMIDEATITEDPNKLPSILNKNYALDNNI
jgi:hypothetical protein